MKITIEVHDAKVELFGNVESVLLDVPDTVRVNFTNGKKFTFSGSTIQYRLVVGLIPLMAIPEPPPVPVPPEPSGWPCFCTGPDDECENCAAGEAVLRCEFNVHGRACGDIARHVSKGIYLCDDHIVEVSKSWDR